MAMAKTLAGPVVPIGDHHYGLGMDGTGRLCYVSTGRFVRNAYAERSHASRAGIWTEPDGADGLICARPSADGLTWVPLVPPQYADVLRDNWRGAVDKLGADANPPTGPRNRAVADLHIKVGSLAIDSQYRVYAADGSVMMDTPDNRRRAHEAGIRGMASRRAGDGILRASWIETAAEFDGRNATVELGTAPHDDIVMGESLQFVGTMNVGPGGMIGDGFQLVRPGSLDPRTASDAAAMKTALADVAKFGREYNRSCGLPDYGPGEILYLDAPADPVTGTRLADVLDTMRARQAETRREPMFNGPVDLGPNPGRAFPTLGRDQRRTESVASDIASEAILRMAASGQSTPEERHQAQLRLIQQSMAAQSHLWPRSHGRTRAAVALAAEAASRGESVKLIGVDLARGPDRTAVSQLAVGDDGEVHMIQLSSNPLRLSDRAFDDIISAGTPAETHGDEMTDEKRAFLKWTNETHLPHTTIIDRGTDISDLTSDVVDAARASLLPTDKGAALKVAADALVKAYGFEFDEALAAVTGAVGVAGRHAAVAVAELAPTLDELRRQWTGKPEPNRDDYDRGLAAADAAVRELRHKQQCTAELLADELVGPGYGDRAQGASALHLLQVIREDLAIPADMGTRLYLRCMNTSNRDALALLLRCVDGPGHTHESGAKLQAIIERFLAAPVKP